MANILLVDYRPENLLALEGILAPLGQPLLYAHSGEEALRQLLRHDVAVILLDVQMPELDGFETATLIKQRERTSHVPIIFITAISKDEEQVFRGYSAGAVDYVFKPFNPQVLRSKVAVFIELYEKSMELRRQAELLKEQELAELRRESEERYRFLAEAQPDQIWTAQPTGELDYVNQRALDYFELPFAELVEHGWTALVHPEDLGHMLERWQQALATGQPYENALRLRRGSDGSFRWHLTRAIARTDRGGAVLKWFGSNTDIDDQKRAEEVQRFLVEAGAVLASSLNYRSTLATVARLAVPRIADWARVDVLEEGTLRTVGVEHVDQQKLELARRAALAIENAQLYREVEERAQAARVLETVDDGVFLVDAGGIVRLCT